MSTLASSYHPITARALNSGSSKTARMIELFIVDAIRPLKEASSLQRSAFDELEDVRAQATRFNWDNLGSASLDELTYQIAKRFLWAIPSNLPAPEVTVDRDGEANFDWFGKQGKNFSVSLRKDGRLAFAGQFSTTRRVSGTDNFDDTVPQEILFGLKTCGPEPLTTQRSEVEFVETVGRFIYQNSDFSRSNNLPKPKVFLPEKHPTLNRWETSVCRTNKVSETRIWQIGNKIREPRQAVARADIGVQDILTTQLLVEAVPEEGYAEHAVIVNWPDEKEKQKEMAASLVFHATLKYPIA